jgi:hypothetical protein
MNISADVPVLLHQAFESDRSIAWTIVKTVKRAIAGNTQGVGLRAHAIHTPKGPSRNKRAVWAMRTW